MQLLFITFLQNNDKKKNVNTEKHYLGSNRKILLIVKNFNIREKKEKEKNDKKTIERRETRGFYFDYKFLNINVYYEEAFL